MGGTQWKILFLIEAEVLNEKYPTKQNESRQRK